jgi:Tfp pilus assembly protein PilO
MTEQPKRFPWQIAAVAAGVCLGASVAAYALGAQPLVRHRQAEAARAAELHERRDRAGQLGAELSALQRQLDDARQALARTPLRLQPATLVNQRVEAITRLATDCNVALDEMRPGPPVDSTHYQTVAIRIVGRGRYPAFTTFLRKLRATFGDVGVRSFSASSDPRAQADSATAVFQAELIWYTELPRK